MRANFSLDCCRLYLNTRRWNCYCFNHHQHCHFRHQARNASNDRSWKFDVRLCTTIEVVNGKLRHRSQDNVIFRNNEHFECILALSLPLLTVPCNFKLHLPQFTVVLLQAIRRAQGSWNVNSYWKTQYRSWKKNSKLTASKAMTSL